MDVNFVQFTMLMAQLEATDNVLTCKLVAYREAARTQVDMTNEALAFVDHYEHVTGQRAMLGLKLILGKLSQCMKSGLRAHRRC